jgi:hypothetical protein
VFSDGIPELVDQTLAQSPSFSGQRAQAGTGSRRLRVS